MDGFVLSCYLLLLLASFYEANDKIIIIIILQIIMPGIVTAWKNCTIKKLFPSGRDLKILPCASLVWLSLQKRTHGKFPHFGLWTAKIALNYHPNVCCERVQKQHKIKMSRDHLSLLNHRKIIIIIQNFQTNASPRWPALCKIKSVNFI